MKINELTKFAITLGLLPWIPAYLLYKHTHFEAAKYVLIIFLGLSLLCFISKPFARWFKDILTKIGKFLGKYIAIVVLFICYVLAVLPTGLLMKAVKRDRLRLKKPDVQTYWVDNNNDVTDYEYQFSERNDIFTWHKCILP